MGRTGKIYSRRRVGRERMKAEEDRRRSWWGGGGVKLKR
jgi:hypothetical protein